MAQSFPDLKQIFLKRTRLRTAKTVRGRVCFFLFPLFASFNHLKELFKRFLSDFVRFKKFFMYFDVDLSLFFIDFYTNISYTITIR